MWKCLVMDGVETARRIQDMDPHAALVFATAHEGYREEAFAVYAFDYLVKPFRNERVLATLSASAGCSEAGRICRQKP